jgi:hypothetical protein
MHTRQTRFGCPNATIGIHKPFPKASPIKWVLAVFLAMACGAAGIARAASASDQATEPPANREQAGLAERFNQPPAESRIIKIIHSWPDAAVAQGALIRSLGAQGFGGVVCNVSFTDYLESEEKWQAFKRAVALAKEAGMSLWLYDEKGYPSGAAGGIVLRDHPEWEARGLLIADKESDSGSVALDLPPGKPFLIAAFPVANDRIELKGLVDLAPQVHEGKLSWQAPAGRWRVMAITESRLYDGTHASMSLGDKLPYVNLLQAEPTARFLEVTHQRYAAHLGSDLGKSFVSTFTDEPSLMSMFLRPMPYRVLPWSPEFPVEFQRRRGHAVQPLIPALIADAGPEGERARYDFWLTVGELVAENYFGQIQKWCAAHHVLSGGHLLMEENIVTHVPLYGDFFRCLRRLDAPSIDCLTSLPSEVPWFIARQASSAAELEGKTVVMCETSDHSQRYRPSGDKRPVRNVSEAEIRGTCNRLIVSGVNAITSYYSFTALTDEQLRRLNEWVGRCCCLLKGGHQVADIALLYPIESVWPRFTPARNWANDSPSAGRIETTYRAAGDSLFNSQRDFTYVDGRALAEARAVGGQLQHGDLHWRVIVLPCADTLPLAAWENLARLVRGGGAVVALGALPRNSEAEFPSPRVQALAREIFGEPTNEPRVSRNGAGGVGIFLATGSEGLLPHVLDGLLEPDLKVTRARSGDVEPKEPTLNAKKSSRGSAPLRLTHRRVAGQEVYFVINDGSEPWLGAISLGANGPGERWNPATGQMNPVTSGEELTLNLEPYGGMLFRFASARPLKRFDVQAGVLPHLVPRNLPAVKPVVVGGEFVRQELAPDQVHSREDRPAWQATGTLTKGQVDTFLFMRLMYPQLLDLSAADCLVLESWTPDGQRSPVQLLVILQDKNGGDFLASTGRSLGTAGHNLTYVPFSQFQLAGWSSGKNPHLDLSRVAEVRLGWGGYLGSEGERVQFSVALPRAAGEIPP